MGFILIASTLIAPIAKVLHDISIDHQEQEILELRVKSNQP